MRQVFLCLFFIVLIFSLYLYQTIKPLQTEVVDMTIQVHIDDKIQLIQMPAYSQVKDLIQKLNIDTKRYELKHLSLHDYLQEGSVYTFPLKKKQCVSINADDEKTLQLVDGIGPKTAEAIVKYREENGFFSRIDDLLEVKGIGEKKLEKIKEQVCL